MGDGAGRLKHRLKPALMVVAVAFVAYAAWDLSRRWESSAVEVRWLPVLLSTLPLGLGALLQGWGWIALIERMSGKRVPFGRSLSLYLDSQIARYTPGKVGLPVVRMAGAPLLGVAARTVGSSVLIEMLSYTAVGALLGFGGLALTNAHAAGVTALLGKWGIPVLVASALGVLCLLWVDRRRYPSRLLAMLQVEGSGALVPLRLPLVHVAYWGTWMVHGYLISRAVGAEPAVALASAGLYVLAPVAGFVVLAAPAGAGVREAVLAIGLAPTVGAAPALTAAIAARGVSLFVDVGVWLVVRRLTRAGKKQ
jgi:glycosyltransferase 2 family protein